MKLPDDVLLFDILPLKFHLSQISVNQNNYVLKHLLRYGKHCVKYEFPVVILF